jgi:hypothetical protein
MCREYQASGGRPAQARKTIRQRRPAASFQTAGGANAATSGTARKRAAVGFTRRAAATAAPADAAADGHVKVSLRATARTARVTRATSA